MGLTIGDQVEALRDRPQHSGRPPAGTVALDLAQARVGTLGRGGGGREACPERLGVEFVGVQVEAGVASGLREAGEDHASGEDLPVGRAADRHGGPPGMPHR